MFSCTYRPLNQFSLRPTTQGVDGAGDYRATGARKSGVASRAGSLS